MEKQRCVKMDNIMKNMLLAALLDLFRKERDESRPFEESGRLYLKLQKYEEKKLFLTDSEYRKAVQALNMLRDTFIKNGRYTDGIDVILLKILKSRYKKCAVR